MAHLYNDPSWMAAAEVATQRARDTAELVPQLGRARPLAERSVGTPDAGATSMAMLITAVGRVIAQAADHTASTEAER